MDFTCFREINRAEFFRGWSAARRGWDFRPDASPDWQEGFRFHLHIKGAAQPPQWDRRGAIN